MKLDQVGAQAKVDIGVDARGSQQLVVLLLVLSGMSGTGTAIFMWHRHELWGWLGAATLGLVGAAIWCHSKSRPYLDRSAARPTKLTTSTSGIEVETDALTLADPEAAAALERVMASVFHRTALPPPDGRLLPDRQVDRSAAAIKDAQDEVSQVNRHAHDTRQRTIDLLTGAPNKRGGEVEQPSAIHAPPNVPDAAFLSTTAMPSAPPAQ